MSSRTLYDQGVTQAQWGEQLLHTKPCVNIQLPQPEHSLHREASEAERDKALKSALGMLSAVLARSSGNTKAIVDSPAFVAKSVELLLQLLCTSSFPSLPHQHNPSASPAPLSTVPPIQQQRWLKIDFCDREYFVDSVCRNVRTLVELDCGPHLFAELEQCLKGYVTSMVELLTSSGEDGVTADVLFVRLAHAWGHYYLAVAELQEVWVYFDRWYVFKTHAVKSIEGLAIEILREGLLLHPWLLPRAQLGYLDCLSRDIVVHANSSVENGNGDDWNSRHELRLFTDLCAAVQVYFLRVEPEIVALVGKFYMEEADRMWSAGVPAGIFFARVEQFLLECRERVRACLVSYSLPKLESVTQSSLLLTHGVAFLERDFANLAMEKKYDCFRLAWRLLASGKYVRLGKQCNAVFRAYILQQGLLVMQRFAARSVERDVFGTVKAMIELMHRGETIISEGFPEDSATFSIQLRDALTEVLQGHQMEFVEQLARYLDWVVRGSDTSTALGQSDHSESKPMATADGSSDVDGVLKLLDDIGRIYSLFPSKDIFEKLYWRDLARRLLHHPRGTPCVDVEGHFIQILREIVGTDAAKFEGMVNDLMSSQELNERFRLWVVNKHTEVPPLSPPPTSVANEEDDQTETPQPKAQHNNEGYEEEEENHEAVEAALAAVDVKLNVLTDGYWPKQTPLSTELPPQLRVLAKSMEVFYRKCFAKRRLIWLHQLSSAVVKSAVGNSRRQLSGTLVQANVLLALQEIIDAGMHSEQLCVSVGEICGQLGLDISLPDVVGAILGLCHPKFRLLLRAPGPGTDGSNQHGSDDASGYGSSVGVVAATLLGTDILRINHSFSVPSQFCRIPFLGARRRGGDGAVDERAADTDGEQTMEDIMKDRVHVVDAAIVRLMKQRRRASHEEVMEEVPKLVRFPVTASAVKESARRLTERGFLERGNTNEYIYIS